MNNLPLIILFTVTMSTLCIIGSAQDDTESFAESAAKVQIEWSLKSYHYGITRPHGLLPTEDGGYITTANTFSVDQGFTDFVFHVSKIGKSGKLIWERTFAPRQYNEITAVKALPGNGLFLAAQIGDATDGKPNVIDGDTLLLKLDEAGNIIWSAEYPVGQAGVVSNLLPLNNDEFIMVYSVESDDAMRVSRHKANGDVVWSTPFSRQYQEYETDIIATEDGGCLLAGSRHHGDGIAASDAWFVKLDARGKQQWTVTYGAGDEPADASEQIPIVRALPGGGFLSAFISTSNETNIQNLMLLKLDEQGNIVFDKQYEQAQGLTPKYMNIRENRVRIVGPSSDYGENPQFARDIELDFDGNLLSLKTIETPVNESLSILLPDEDNGYIALDVLAVPDCDNDQMTTLIVFKLDASAIGGAMP